MKTPKFYNAVEHVRAAVFAVCNTMVSRSLWKQIQLSDIGGQSPEARAKLEQQLGIGEIASSWTLDQLASAVTEKK